MPKVRNGNRLPPTGVQKGVKDKKNIVEVSPIRMPAKIQGHSLVLTGSDGSQITIGLLDCTVLAVSASNLPSRKWFVHIKFVIIHWSSTFLRLITSYLCSVCILCIV